MLIAIPSKGRPGKVKSASLLPNAVIYVPEQEASDYRRFGYKNITPVPNEVRGITKTRNFILDNSQDPWVVMIDDDVKSAGFIELRRTSGKHRKIKTWEREFQRLFELTEDFSFRIWGVATHSARRAVYPCKPLLFASYITASCMGIRNDTGIRFDESFPVKEDYEIGLRCVKEDGGVIAARYLYWENSHWSDDGGCKDYRTGEMEKDCIDRLVKMYPGFIRRVQRNGTNYSIELEF